MLDKKTLAEEYRHFQRSVVLKVEDQISFMEKYQIKSAKVKMHLSSSGIRMKIFSANSLEPLWQKECGLPVRYRSWCQPHLRH